MKRLQLSLFLKRFFQKRCNQVSSFWSHHLNFCQGYKTNFFKAKYGKALLENLSKDLSRIHEKGFSRSNLNNMRLFYQSYPICEELPHKLSWTHFCELIKINDSLERSFYEKQTIIENWSTTELIRQKRSSLYLRLAASKDKEGILLLSKQGQIVQHPSDLRLNGVSHNYLQINYFNCG